MMASSEETIEAFRLTELHNLSILDTPPEPEYDALVKLASELFNCPMSTLTLVDSDRQWFKASVGISVSSTSRDVSFCQHAIKLDRPLVINDALMDCRVCDSPLVKSSPNLRSYLGVPLRGVNKALVGTFCVLDSVARKWTDREIQLLVQFAKIAEMLLQKHENCGGVSKYEFHNGREFVPEQAICGAWDCNINSSVVRMSPSLRGVFGLPLQMRIDKMWFSSFGINRDLLNKKIINDMHFKDVMHYDFTRPDGSLLKIEETIHRRNNTGEIQICGVIRLLHTGKVEQNKSSRGELQLTCPHASAHSIFEWLAKKPSGFLHLNHLGVIQIFNEDEENTTKNLPVPLQACFLSDDLIKVQNESAAVWLGLRTNVLFVQNLARTDHNDWLKLQFIGLRKNGLGIEGVVIQFTQMLNCGGSQEGG